jgi:hypothetical protein
MSIRPGAALLQTIPEARGIRVRRDEDIASCTFEKRKAPLEVFGIRIFFSATEPEAVGGNG